MDKTCVDCLYYKKTEDRLNGKQTVEYGICLANPPTPVASGGLAQYPLVRPSNPECGQSKPKE